MKTWEMYVGYFGTSGFLPHSDHWDHSLPPSTAVAVGYSVFMLCVLMTVSLLIICVPLLLSSARIPAEMVNIGSNSLALSAACHVSSISYAVTGVGMAKGDQGQSSTTRTSDGGGAGGRSSSSSRSSSHKNSMEQPPPTYHDPKPDDAGGDAEDGYELKRLPTPELCNALLRSRTVASDEVWFAAISGRPALGSVARRKIRWGVVRMPPEWYTQFDDETPVEHLSFGVKEDNVAPPIVGRWYA